MSKEELLFAAFEDFKAKYEKENKKPYGDEAPDYLAVNYKPADDPKSVVFVLRSGHKHAYSLPSKPAVSTRVGRGRVVSEPGAG